jgi:hypothetical protein
MSNDKRPPSERLNGVQNGEKSDTLAKPPEKPSNPEKK